MKTQINAVFPEPYVQQILVKGWQPPRGSHGRRQDKLRRANSETIAPIECSLGEFNATLGGDGPPQQATLDLIAVVNPDAESRLAEAANNTHDARIREAVASAIHSLTVADVKDLEHKHLKELLVKAINEVLPEPWIRQIVVREFQVSAVAAEKEATDRQNDKQNAKSKTGKVTPSGSKRPAKPDGSVLPQPGTKDVPVPNGKT